MTAESAPVVMPGPFVPARYRPRYRVTVTPLLTFTDTAPLDDVEILANEPMGDAAALSFNVRILVRANGELT
jgi:hypothetical protein